MTACGVSSAGLPVSLESLVTLFYVCVCVCVHICISCIYIHIYSECLFDERLHCCFTCALLLRFTTAFYSCIRRLTAAQRHLTAGTYPTHALKEAFCFLRGFVF
jgi:hypothetical protein